MLVNRDSFNQLNKKQDGLVLFVALIALVVMSLAGVSLIRSVDTNSQIAGNLAFKQNTVISSNIGLEAMADTVGKQTLAYAVKNSPTDGYYATCNKFDLSTDAECDGGKLTDDAIWVDANSKKADGDGIAAGKDQFGNTIRYIVERMSTDGDEDDEIDVTKTLMASIKDLDLNGASTKGTGEEQGSTLENKSVPLPIYRITLRIEGPKDAVSYVQAYFS